MNGKISVIIPYYQKKSGILRRALRSVCAQTGVSNFELVVVDDGSPRSAKDELRDFSTSPGISIRVIEQANAGPGAARNTGLDSVAKDAEYVAFLDSDDEWSVDHLSRAIAVLQKGYDFYFSNYFEIGQKITAFERHGRIDLKKHTPLSGLDDAFEYRGDFFHQEIMAPLAHTPTIVYRYTKFPDVRFTE